MESNDVIQLIANTDAVPPLPVVVGRMLQVADNPSSNAMDLANIIAEDTALTARVLKLVNSSFYGFSREISTVTESVILLGFEAITNLVIGMTITSLMAVGQSRVLDRQRFWQHSLGAAAAARILSRLVDYPNPEEAFIAGLMHDIGKLFFDEYMPDEYAAVVRLLHAGERNELRAEHDVLQTDHASAGQMLLRRWRLPVIYQLVTRYHHAPLQCEARLSTRTGKLVGCTYLADVFTKMHGDACDADAYVPTVDPRVWKLMRLTDENGSRVFLMFDQEVKRAREFFGIACSDDLGDINLVKEGEIKRVILARRHQPSVSTIKIILTAAGFEVSYGLITRQGIEMPPGAEAHIVIIDEEDIAADFGNMDSFVAQVLTGNDLRVVILREQSTPKYEAEIHERQGVFFLEKPFRAADLVEKLRNILGTQTRGASLA
jgi:HD-like signal output (HDOD) protein